MLDSGSVDLSAQSAAPTTAAVSRVHQLEIEDQSENPGTFGRRIVTGMKRRAVRKFASYLKREAYLRRRLLRRCADFQHGQTPEDFLFAHALAVEALIRGESAEKWIVAATLDRYLQAGCRSTLATTCTTSL